jgi:AraC-like DNA-binding protein
VRQNDTYERFEQFEAAASQSFVPVRVRVPPDVGFHATLGDATVNGVVIARIASTPCWVQRDARTIGSADPEMVKVALHRSGRADVEQDGRRCSARPGDLVAYDTTKPYRLRYVDPFDITVIAIPRARLGINAELIGQRSASVLPATAGVRSVVSACLTGLNGSLDEVPRAAGMHLADALVSLVISAFAGDWRAEPDADLGDRILAHCLANLADPNLSVVSVARQHGISVRYLHKLLSCRGTSPAAWIRRERLHRIHRDLSNPAFANRTTVEIAARWGILDPTHLGRALKAEFGQTAKEIRQAALPSA